MAQKKTERKTLLVMALGEVVRQQVFIELLRSHMTSKYVVVCLEGDPEIKSLLDATPDGKLSTFRLRQHARDALEQKQVELQDTLTGCGIFATVVIPVISVGDVLCPVSADVFVRAAYFGYDELFVVTSNGDTAIRQQLFADLKKVKIIGLW